MRCTWRSRRYCSAPGRTSVTGLDLPALGYQCSDRVPGEKAAHFTVRRR